MTKISTGTLDNSCKIIGGLIVLSALTKLQLLFDLFHFNYFLNKVIVIIYFSSAIIASFGLWRLRLVGFIFAYVHIIFATIFLSISVIPFLFKLMSFGNLRATVMLVIVNLSMLVMTAFLHCIKMRHLKKVTIEE
jgi:uncharacterized membrane protein (DUF2068 family)